MSAGYMPWLVAAAMTLGLLASLFTFGHVYAVHRHKITPPADPIRLVLAACLLSFVVNAGYALTALA